MVDLGADGNKLTVKIKTRSGLCRLRGEGVMNYYGTSSVMAYMNSLVADVIGNL